MKLNINFRKIAADVAIIDHIDRRLSFAFARTKHAIQSADITVSDINGPKGGVDKECRAVIKPKGLTPIVISELQPSMKLAIDHCLARASQSLSRQLKRKRQSLRTRLTLKQVQPIEAGG